MFKSFRFLKFKFIYFAAKINKRKIFANNIGNIVKNFKALEFNFKRNSISFPFPNS